MIDFSSLFRHTRRECGKEQPKTKTKDVNKKNKLSAESLPEKNLLNLLTSDLPIEDILDNTVLDVKPKVIVIFLPQPFNQLQRHYNLKLIIIHHCLHIQALGPSTQVYSVNNEPVLRTVARYGLGP